VDEDTAILQIGGEGQQKLHKEQGTNRISDRGGKATLRTTDGKIGDNRNFRSKKEDSRNSSRTRGNK
jgi:hypothetical protein